MVRQSDLALESGPSIDRGVEAELCNWWEGRKAHDWWTGAEEDTAVVEVDSVVDIDFGIPGRKSALEVVAVAAATSHELFLDVAAVPGFVAVLEERTSSKRDQGRGHLLLARCTQHHTRIRTRMAGGAVDVVVEVGEVEVAERVEARSRQGLRSVDGNTV